jgi:hypothetical protein
MTTSPIAPKLLKAGLVRLDRDSATVLGIVPLQYNPESLTRSFQPKGADGSADRAEALRLSGPPVETMTLEAALDATDALEFPDNNEVTVSDGIAPHLAAIETMIYPASAALQRADELAASGMIEVLPEPEPLTLFVWGRNRITPVRLTEVSITEEAFDINLNPTRAKLNLSMRVLSVDDLGFGSLGGSLFLAYQQRKEALAGLFPGGSLDDLGVADTL